MSIDVNEVGIPVKGLTAWAPRSAQIPTQAQMRNASFDITSLGYTVLGLRTADGAPDWAEAKAAPIEVYEEGYEVSPANGTLTVTQTLAQRSDVITAILYGVTVNQGVVDIDIDSMPEGRIFTEDWYRMPDGSYQIVRKIGPQATVNNVTDAKNSRGQISGTTFGVSVKRSDELPNRGHYRRALLAADPTPDPMIHSILPAGNKVGDTVVISGIHFTGMTGVKVDDKAVVAPLLASDDTIVIVIPTGVTAGQRDVVVTTANGPSAAVKYTVAS